MKIRTFGKIYSFVLTEDQKLPKEQQTVWLYKVPSLELQEKSFELNDFEFVPGEEEGIRREKVKMSLLNKKYRELVRECLVKVENLRDDNDQVIKIDDFQSWTKEQQDELFAVIPHQILELGMAFENATIVTDDERKNSK